MFETYEERFPFESKYIEGGEPKAQVERLTPEPNGPHRFNTTPAGLLAFASKAERFRLSELHLNLTGYSGPLNLRSLTRPDDITHLTVLQSVDLGHRFGAPDFEGLADFSGLQSLQLGLVPIEPPWLPAKTNLRILAGDAASISSILLDQKSQALEQLDITNFDPAHLTLPDLATLTWLRIRGAPIGSLGLIASAFPNLDVLQVEGVKGALDVTALNQLKHLKAVKILGPKTLRGIENVHLPALSSCYLSALDSSHFIENNPQLEWARIARFNGEISGQMTKMGIEKIGKEIGLGGRRIPQVLRS